MLGVGIGGEAFPGVSGELVGEGDIDAEEIVEGVFVFLRGEAAGVHASGSGELGAVGGDERGLEGFEKSGEVLGGGAFLFLGRHFAGLDALEDVLPELAVGFVFREKF